MDYPFIFGANAGSGGGGGSSATLEIGVFSDSGATIPITSADFGDTVYIKLTVVGITPTNYRFFICENNVNFDLIEQATNIYAKTISTFNDLVIYGEAEDGSIAACALDATTLTINSDVDANAFIAAHNALSGQVMAAAQQEVVQGIYQRLKGTGTTYGSDLWTLFRSNSASRAYPLIPINDSTVSVDAYALDMIWLNQSATYNGFILTDFLPTGVTGGASKFFEIDKSPSDFGQNDLSCSVYVRTDRSGDECAFGAGNTFNTNSTNFRPRLGSLAYYFVNSAVQTPYSNANSQGAYTVNRSSSTEQQLFKNGTLVYSALGSSQTPTTNNMFFHGMNIGSLNRISISELSFYSQLPSLTTFEAKDLDDLIQYIQLNVITGGRNV